jgi:hypothetical protein
VDEEPYVPVLSQQERKRLLRQWRSGTPDLGTRESVKAERRRIEALAADGVLDAGAAAAGLAGVLRGLEAAERCQGAAGC